MERKVMKKINFFIIIIFIAANVFAQSSLYLGTTKEEFIFKPSYIILGDIELRKYKDYQKTEIMV